MVPGSQEVNQGDDVSIGSTVGISRLCDYPVSRVALRHKSPVLSARLDPKGVALRLKRTPVVR